MVFPLISAKRHLYALTKDVSLQARVQTTYVTRTNGRATETTHQAGAKQTPANFSLRQLRLRFTTPTNKVTSLRFLELHICLRDMSFMPCLLSEPNGRRSKAAIADRHSNIQIHFHVSSSQDTKYILNSKVALEKMPKHTKVLSNVCFVQHLKILYSSCAQICKHLALKLVSKSEFYSCPKDMSF